MTEERIKFLKLQKLWYSKIKKVGFQDIEWIDHQTGHGQDASPYLKRPSWHLRTKFSQQTAHYYNQCTNFVAHVRPVSPKELNVVALWLQGHSIDELVRRYKLNAHRIKTDRRFIEHTIESFLEFDIIYCSEREFKVFRWYSEGVPYRKICKRLKHKPKSIFWVHKVIVKLLPDVQRFNHHNPEGLDCYVDPLNQPLLR